MDKLYAQVVNGFVNLIGGEGEGLPLSERYLKSEYPDIINIDLTDRKYPQIGDYYDHETDVFIDREYYNQIKSIEEENKDAEE